MRVRDIKLVARKHLEGADIAVLEGPSATPEHRLVAQYEQISAAADWLDQQAFEIGRNFLAELNASASDNPTLKCLSIINKSAFDEPTEEDCAYLMQHAESQARYGLNVYMTVADGWECAGRSEKEIQDLKLKLFKPLELTGDDISRLRTQFKAAGTPVGQIGEQVDAFLSACKKRKIAVPAP